MLSQLTGRNDFATSSSRATRPFSIRSSKRRRRFFAGERFVWMGNTDTPDHVWGCRSGQRLPNTPHGLNDYQDVHNCAVLSALNLTPAFYSYLSTRGVNSVEAKDAVYRSACYQAIMRCSIRDPGCVDPVRIVVMDYATAEFLASLFSGAQIKQLPGMPKELGARRAGRPKKHKSEAARKAKYRDDIRAEMLQALERITSANFVSATYLSSNLCPGNHSIDREINGTNISAPISLPIYESIYDQAPFLLPSGDPALLDYAGADDFIEFLRCLSLRKIRDKKDAYLISPAHFVANPLVDTSRGLANIKYIHGVWFDCDGGDLEPDVFADLFPHLRMAIYSTFSSTKAARRWRAFVPTTHAMTIDVHRLIVDQMLRIVNDAGFWSDKQLGRAQRHQVA